MSKQPLYPHIPKRAKFVQAEGPEEEVIKRLDMAVKSLGEQGQEFMMGAPRVVEVMQPFMEKKENEMEEENGS
jgi:hypothetical protein